MRHKLTDYGRIECAYVHKVIPLEPLHYIFPINIVFSLLLNAGSLNSTDALRKNAQARPLIQTTEVYKLPAFAKGNSNYTNDHSCVSSNWIDPIIIANILQQVLPLRVNGPNYNKVGGFVLEFTYMWLLRTFVTHFTIKHYYYYWHAYVRSCIPLTSSL